jgi:hypothetical protein
MLIHCLAVFVTRLPLVPLHDACLAAQYSFPETIAGTLGGQAKQESCEQNTSQKSTVSAPVVHIIGKSSQEHFVRFK